jgi:Dyp-type peroxidase family
MAVTPIEELLKRPIAWKRWLTDQTTRHVLQNLQANIVKGHGREHTRHLFWNFQGAQVDDLRAVVHRLARAMPSALDQLLDTETFKATGRSGPPVLCFFLRPSGYAALDAAGKAPQQDAPGTAFSAGMKARGTDAALGINDPAATAWEGPFQGQIDAMLLVAAQEDEVDAVAERWRNRFVAAGATHLGTAEGKAIRRQVAGKFEGVEHFGYVDGRSQPLFLAEDVEGEMRAHWDPAFPPSQFLVDDPGDTDPASLGSFFVFRKLEQNVAGFKAQEDDLATKLNLPAVFKERAGALIVGRFEDGTPVVLDPMRTDMPPVNDFDFRDDVAAQKCPFLSHIRKTNPRGESPFHLAAFASTTVRQERGHIMARRGITYGERQYDPATNDFTDTPTGGVGLLFMAYMSSLENQFEFTQSTWANNANFVTGNTGVDPVIAQGPGPKADVPDGWSGNQANQFDFGRFVTLKGGEYFFAPAVNVLRNI